MQALEDWTRLSERVEAKRAPAAGCFCMPRGMARLRWLRESADCSPLAWRARAADANFSRDGRAAYQRAALNDALIEKPEELLPRMTLAFDRPILPATIPVSPHHPLRQALERRGKNAAGRVAGRVMAAKPSKLWLVDLGRGHRRAGSEGWRCAAFDAPGAPAARGVAKLMNGSIRAERTVVTRACRSCCCHRRLSRVHARALKDSMVAQGAFGCVTRRRPLRHLIRDEWMDRLNGARAEVVAVNTVAHSERRAVRRARPAPLAPMAARAAAAEAQAGRSAIAALATGIGGGAQPQPPAAELQDVAALPSGGAIRWRARAWSRCQPRGVAAAMRCGVAAGRRRGGLPRHGTCDPSRCDRPPAATQRRAWQVRSRCWLCVASGTCAGRRAVLAQLLGCWCASRVGARSEMARHADALRGDRLRMDAPDAAGCCAWKVARAARWAYGTLALRWSTRCSYAAVRPGCCRPARARIAPAAGPLLHAGIAACAGRCMRAADVARMQRAHCPAERASPVRRPRAAGAAAMPGGRLVRRCSRYRGLLASHARSSSQEVLPLRLGRCCASATLSRSRDRRAHAATVACAGRVCGVSQQDLIGRLARGGHGSAASVRRTSPSGPARRDRRVVRPLAAPAAHGALQAIHPSRAIGAAGAVRCFDGRCVSNRLLRRFDGC
ncbi:MAG: hypothetical protein WDW38_004718 [Sanguina aurantia]